MVIVEKFIHKQLINITFNCLIHSPNTVTGNYFFKNPTE
jgi:hypothetical protein